MAERRVRREGNLAAGTSCAEERSSVLHVLSSSTSWWYFALSESGLAWDVPEMNDLFTYDPVHNL